MPLKRLKTERLELLALSLDELGGLLERYVEGLELAENLLSPNNRTRRSYQAGENDARGVKRPRSVHLLAHFAN